MKQDVIVIGSGPIGACCARNLAEHGLNVLLLEAGDIISSPPGSHLRNQKKYQQEPDLFFNEIIEWCKTYRESAKPNELPGANVTNAYGGQGLLWTNNCPRAVKHELPNYYTEKEWDELYKHAESYLQVNTALFDNSIRQQKIIETLTQPLAKQNRSIKKVPLAARRINDSTINFTATFDILSIPETILKRIKVECNSHVTRLITTDDHISAVEVKQGDKLKKLEADKIIIAAGAFDTTQLLYDSNIRPNALGHYLHFHPLHVAQVVLDEAFSTADNIIDLPPRTCIYPTEQSPWHSMILRDIFPPLSEEHVNNNELIDMQFFVPIEVRESNKMILSSKSPKFDVQLSEKDEKTLAEARQDLINIAQQLGRFRQGAEPITLDYGFTHPMGMCRLGDDPQTSVTDPLGKVHGYSNLYLATVGLIPNLMAVNPTLTAAAIAIATTNAIVK